MPQRVLAPQPAESPLHRTHDAMRVLLPQTPDSHSLAASEAESELGPPLRQPQAHAQHAQHVQHAQHAQASSSSSAAAMAAASRSPMARSMSGKSDDTGATYKDQVAAQQASNAIARVINSIVSGPRNWEEKVGRSHRAALHGCAARLPAPRRSLLHGRGGS
jgi:hypothetical protein